MQQLIVVAMCSYEYAAWFTVYKVNDKVWLPVGTETKAFISYMLVSAGL